MKSGVTIRIVLTACLSLGMARFGQGQPTSAVELQAAIATEQVKGDLDGAIAAYKKIAARASAPRNIRAKALLRLAGCYEKEGDQALSVYQEIVRDFADQPEAKLASAKLAASHHQEGEPGSGSMTQHKVEGVGPLAGHSFAFNNTDGRSFLFRDRVNQALMLGDLASGQSRLVFKPWADSDDLGFLFPSKDLSMLYGRMTQPGGKQINAVVKMDGTGYREIPGRLSGRPDWSWDNRFVLICADYPDGTRRRVRIMVSDGDILALPGPARCLQMFSPDGRYIASEDGNKFSAIFVGLAGVEGQLLALPDTDSGNAKLMGWTPDGRYLALAIDRSGTEGFYLVPMKDGRAAGDPVFIRYGSFLIGQVFANGALVYESAPSAGQYATWLGTLDSAGQVTSWQALPLNGGRAHPTAPAWSPDGNRIAYVASNAAAGQNSQIVHLRDLTSGEDRELYHARSGEMNCVWAAQHPNLFCGLTTPRNATDLFSISTESGNARQIGSVAGMNHLMDVTPDNRGIYISSSDGQLSRWDMATQKADPQGPGRSNQGVVGWVVTSPDKRWISRLEKGQIEVRELAVGDWKSLVSGGGTQAAFSKDGNWFLYHGVDSAGKQALLRVPVMGGQPERLGDFPASEKVGLMWLSPDGRKIIADSLNPYETWVLENFEPKR